MHNSEINSIETVVAIFIKNNKLLIEKRSKSKNVYAGFLMCPSGHIENNETFEEAINREMKEELGLPKVKSNYLFSIMDRDPFSNTDFNHNIMIIESFDGIIRNSSEADELIWMSYEELKKQNLIPVVQTLVEKLHQQKLIL